MYNLKYTPTALGVREQKRLNTTAVEFLDEIRTLIPVFTSYLGFQMSVFFLFTVPATLYCNIDTERSHIPREWALLSGFNRAVIPSWNQN
jgi:hypothetical protein